MRKMEGTALVNERLTRLSRPPQADAYAHAGLRQAAKLPQLTIPAPLSAGVLWLCYFPMAWGFLAWVALVPLLTLVRSNARPRTIYLSAWLGGLVFFWPVLQWMRVADYRMYYTWGALATYCSLYFPLAIFFVRRLDCSFGRRSNRRPKCAPETEQDNQPDRHGHLPPQATHSQARLN